MSDTRADLWNGLLNLLCVVTLFSVLPYPSLGLPELSIEIERYLLYGLTVCVTIAHLHYGAGVVREMCHHFRIRCFKVRSDASSKRTATTTNNLDVNRNGSHPNKHHLNQRQRKAE